MTATTSLRTMCALAALACPASAFAQSEDRYFDGFYISGAVGVESVDDRSQDQIRFDTNRDGSFDDTVRTGTGADAFAPGFCNGSPTDVARAECAGNDTEVGYALRIGADRHLGNGPLVAGVLIEGSLPGIEESTTGFSSTPASYTFSREIDVAVNARARIGFAPGEGRALFYGTGGVGFAKVDRSFTTSNAVNSFASQNEDGWAFGWQAGGGAEVMLSRNIGLGLEYLYSRYDDDDYFVEIGAGTALPTNPFLTNGGGTNIRPSNNRFDYHSLRATLNFRF